MIGKAYSFHSILSTISQKALFNMASDSIESTNRLLKVIIAVLIRSGERQMSLREQIETLNGLGLRPVEIAEILGKTGTHINKELSGMRKKSKGKKKTNGTK